MRVPTDRFRPGRRPFDPPILAAAGVLLTGAFAVHGYTTWRGIQRDAANEVRILNRLAAQATEALFEQISGNVRVISDRLLEIERRSEREVDHRHEMHGRAGARQHHRASSRMTLSRRPAVAKRARYRRAPPAV